MTTTLQDLEQLRQEYLSNAEPIPSICHEVAYWLGNDYTFPGGRHITGKLWSISYQYGVIHIMTWGQIRSYTKSIDDFRRDTLTAVNISKPGNDIWPGHRVMCWYTSNAELTQDEKDKFLFIPGEWCKVVAEYYSAAKEQSLKTAVRIDDNKRRELEKLLLIGIKI